MDTIKADHVIESTLGNANSSVGALFSSDVTAVVAPMMPELDDVIRTAIEDLVESQDAPPSRLSVVLETGGGYVEVVERIVSVFRRHYAEVDFVIPNFAYSAGTILAMSGDEIYMDYYSVLGPIDPQLRVEGATVPGLGYISKYNDLVEEINSTEEGENEKKAQLFYLIKRFDPALLFNIEQSIEHSKALITDWLPKHKFKNWSVTETRKAPVTDEDKRIRAERIASALGDVDRWHSHGRGISMAELEGESIGIKVADFGANPQHSQHIRHYSGLLKDYMGKRGLPAAVHTRNRLMEAPA